MPNAPVGVPDSYEEHVGLMYDMMALAYQSDATRVFTFMMARELSQRSYPQVGVPDPHHATSHHQDNPEKLAKLVKIQNYHLTLFAKFLDKLKATPDGDGNLLDHTTLLYGSCLSNSNIHNHNPLPTLLAGGGAGTLKGGRHLKYPENTPMSNLLLSVLNKIGVPDRQGRRQHQRPGGRLACGSHAAGVLTGVLLASAAFGASNTQIADVAMKGDMDAVRSLVKQHPGEVNASLPDGGTALLWAAYWNDEKAVKALLAAGANVNASNREGFTGAFAGLHQWQRRGWWRCC